MKRLISILFLFLLCVGFNASQPSVGEETAIGWVEEEGSGEGEKKNAGFEEKEVPVQAPCTAHHRLMQLSIYPPAGSDLPELHSGDIHLPPPEKA